MNSYSVAHVLAQKITETKKSLNICYLFHIKHIHFNIMHRQTEMMHQQRVSRSGSAVMKCAVGEWCQHLPLAFMLEKEILSTCCDKDDNDVICVTF